MPNRTNQVAFAVSDREKAAIRQAAAAEDKSMAEFARGRVLDKITPEDVAPRLDDDPDPLADFITARLHREADADPLPKAELYAAYTDFMREVYPDAEIASQHKVSREVAALDGVDTGRTYVDVDGSLEQKRCFTGVRFSLRERTGGD